MGLYIYIYRAGLGFRVSTKGVLVLGTDYIGIEFPYCIP